MKKKGFTLVELLVVIAIIGILIGMLLPAVQMVREAARRTSCANNIRQVALAAHNYQSGVMEFPAGSLYPVVASDGVTPLSSASSRNGWSFHAQILPYLEQSNLSSTINYKMGYKDHPPVDIGGSVAQISRFRIPTYLCPSEINDKRRGEGTAEENYPLNYGVNNGIWFVHNPQNRSWGNGAFGPDNHFDMNHFLSCDGTSNTLMLAEVKAYTPYFRNLGSDTDPGMPTNPANLASLGGDFKTNSGHTEWVDGRTHQSGFTATFSPNTEALHTVGGITYDVDWTNWQEGKNGNSAKPTWAAVTSRSYHPTGGNTARMDGSSAFVTESIDLKVWRSLATRDGGEIISE